MTFPVVSLANRLSSSNGVTVTAPSGVADGDLVVACVRAPLHGSNTDDVESTGFVLHSSQHDHGDVYSAVMTKTSSGSEPASYDFSFPIFTGSIEVAVFKVSGGSLASVTYFEQTSSASDAVTFPATTATKDAAIVRFASLSSNATSFDSAPSGTDMITGTAQRDFGLWQTTSSAGAVSSDSLGFTANKRSVGATIIIEAVSSGLTIDSTDASMQRSTDFQVVCSNPTTTPTTGNTTLTNGNDTLTPSSVTGSDPYTLTFPVGDLTKQVDATGYDWTLTVDAETATTGNIPLAIQAGYTKVDLVDPVTTNASLLFGVTGDAPVTGDDLEYDVTSVLDANVSLDVAANAVWTVTETVEGAWVTDITVSRRVVQADGTIGTEAALTLQAHTATSGVPVGDRTNLQTISAYLIGQGTYSSASTNEVVVEWLADEGYTDQFNKAFYDYLEAQGFTGTLTDKLWKWRNE